MDVLKYKILVLIFLVMITFIVFYKVVEGFDDNFNNYSNTLQNSYLNNSVRTRYNDVFAFYKGKGSYKKEKMEDNNSDDKISLLNELLDKLLNKVVNDTQDCVGSFGKYSECNKSCGSGGHQIRKYKITQKRGENGKACRYEDGEEEKIPCHIRDCDINDECENNIDCITKNCDPSNNKCGPKVECTKDTVHVCNQDECRRLNEEYGNASHVLEGKYLYELTDGKCFFKTPAEIEELNINIYSYNYENPDSYSADQICTYYQKKNDIGLCENINENIVLEGGNPTCKRGFGPEPTILNIENACETCIINDHTEGSPCECSGNSFLDDDNMCLSNPVWNDGGEATCRWNQYNDGGMCKECERGMLTQYGKNELCKKDNKRGANCVGFTPPQNEVELDHSECSVPVCSDGVDSNEWNSDLLCHAPAPPPVTCDAGMYDVSGVCTYCEPGYYCLGGRAEGNYDCGDNIKQGGDDSGRCACRPGTTNPNPGSSEASACLLCAEIDPNRPYSSQGSSSSQCNACDHNQLGETDLVSDVSDITIYPNPIVTTQTGSCFTCPKDEGHWYSPSNDLVITDNDPHYYCRSNEVFNSNYAEIIDNGKEILPVIDSVTNKYYSHNVLNQSEDITVHGVFSMEDRYNCTQSVPNSNSRLGYDYTENVVAAQASGFLTWNTQGGNGCTNTIPCLRKCETAPPGFRVDEYGTVMNCLGLSQEHCATHDPTGTCVVDDDGSPVQRCNPGGATPGYRVVDGIVEECTKCPTGSYAIKWNNNEFCNDNHDTNCSPSYSVCPSDARISPNESINNGCDTYHPNLYTECDLLYHYQNEHTSQPGSERSNYQGPEWFYRKCGYPSSDYYNNWNNNPDAKCRYYSGAGYQGSPLNYCYTNEANLAVYNR